MMRHIALMLGLCLCVIGNAHAAKAKRPVKARVVQAKSKGNPQLAAWVSDFKAEAGAQGVSPAVLNQAFNPAKLLPQVVALDRAQPEFITPLLTYTARHVTHSNVQRGRALLAQHQTLLSDIAQQYGVPANVLVAFWGLETHYGADMGDFGMVSSLMTLAYDGRRAAFFRGQLLDALKMANAGHMTLANMRGSWAGAFGHMQFMPSTFAKYAVDGDGDGKINLKNSLADSFASAAHYLKQVGWQADAPIAIEVQLPDYFDYAQARYGNKKSTAEWLVLGVKPVTAQTLPESAQTSILLPQGWQGPAILIYPNFDVVMDWNRSVNYAVSVALLADNMQTDVRLQGGEEAEAGALRLKEMRALQTKLNHLGFDCGTPDGFPGLKTQDAIRAYQAKQGLPQDGYASESLYERLMAETEDAPPVVPALIAQ